MPINLPRDIYIYYCQPSTFQMSTSELFTLANRFLSIDEKTRLDKLKSPMAKEQFCLSRFLLRNALTELEPAIARSEWQFMKNNNGKPHISNQGLQQPWHFSLSHCHDFIAVGITTIPIGIDVEWSRRRQQPLPVAKRFFSKKEFSQLQTINDEQQRLNYFIRLWTLKEALVKSLGTTMFKLMNKTDFAIENSRISFNTSLSELNTANAQLFQCQVEQSYWLAISTLAVSSDCQSTRIKTIRYNSFTHQETIPIKHWTLNQ